jgi:Domain of unknown function (DUF4432)
VLLQGRELLSKELPLLRFRAAFALLQFNLFALAVGCLPPTRADEPFQKPLYSISRNYHPHELLSPKQRRYQSSDVAPKCNVPWSLALVTLHGGKQEGVEVIVLDNGAMVIDVIPTRGMGIYSVRAGDIRLGWDSPIQEIVHPTFINLTSRAGRGWLDGFSEWLCRCGMESNGAAGTDRILDHAGQETTIDLTLHGRVANSPAQEVDFTAERDPPFRISLRARVDERTFLGPKLELYTELSTEPGSRRFRLRDVVCNRGGTDQEFEMLYHVNFGPPLLEEGSTFLAPLAQVTAANEHAAKDLPKFEQFARPTAGFAEQVYFLRPRSDDAGNVLALIRNKTANRGASVTFSTAELPYLTLWKHTAAVEDGYVVGIEPGTNFPNTRQVERKFGRVPKLAPGAKYAMTLDFAIQLTADEVSSVASQITTIQGQQQPTREQKAASGKN